MDNEDFDFRRNTAEGEYAKIKAALIPADGKADTPASVARTLIPKFSHLLIQSHRDGALVDWADQHLTRRLQPGAGLLTRSTFAGTASNRRISSTGEGRVLDASLSVPVKSA